MTLDFVPNERTAMAQPISDQPDGPGKRICRRGELTIIGKLTPNGAALFRQRLPQFQAEAGYWESRVGTVQDFRILLFDDDTRYMLTVVYDGDFKPYLVDIGTKATEWLDGMAEGVLEDYPGINAPGTARWLEERLVPAEFFYAAHPEATVRDIARMKKVAAAVSDLLDAAG